MRMFLISLPAALILSLAARGVQAENHWPQFRGPDSRGVAADNPALPETWSATEHVVWKTDIAGRGWSSPIVWGQQVFLTTVTSEAPLEEQTKGLYLGGERREPPAAVHHWRVLALDLGSGQVVWDREVQAGPPRSPIHLKNTYASETPVTDGERVYAYFGNVGMFCFTLAGEPVWSVPLGPFDMASGWGTGGSPIVHGDRLYVLVDNEGQSFLLALDKHTGQEVWRVDRPEKSSWSTPYVWTNDQRVEIVASGSGMVRSYDLDGRELWSLGEMSRNAIPTPFADGGLLYVAAGHVMNKNKTLAAIRPGATGSITVEEGQTTSPFVAWAQPKASAYQPSPLVYQGRVYVVQDGSFFASFDAATGKPVIARMRIPEGRMFTSSPWAYNGKVFCLNEDGTTFVIKAGDQFELVGTNPLAEDDMCLACPAVAGDKLLIRTAVRLYCVGGTGDTPPGPAGN